jgi:hypothetical protein
MEQSLQSASVDTAAAESRRHTTMIFTLRDPQSGKVAVLLSRAPNHPDYPEWGFGAFAAVKCPPDKHNTLEQCVYEYTGIQPMHPLVPQSLGSTKIGNDIHEFMHVPLDGTLETIPHHYIQKPQELLAWVRDDQWRYDVSKETTARHVSQPRYFVMTADGEVDVLAHHATFIHEAITQVRHAARQEAPTFTVQTGQEMARAPLLVPQEIPRQVA